MWVLGVELGSSARTIHVLTDQDIWPVQILSLFEKFLVPRTSVLIKLHSWLMLKLVSLPKPSEPAVDDDSDLVCRPVPVPCRPPPPPDRVSLYSLGCPGTHFVDQAGLELRNSPASASRVLGLKACVTTPSDSDLV
jgi:hypothetical protein